MTTPASSARRTPTVFFLMSITSSFFVTGCGESRPEGMPELHPTTVTITQDGKVLSDATVTLYSDDASLRRWPVGGVTDATGTVNLKTFTKYEGVPAGSFKLMVNKTISQGDPRPTHPGENATPEQLRDYDRGMKTGRFEMIKVVNSTYRTAGETPLSIEVLADAENASTHDVGVAVKEVDAEGGVAGAQDYVPMGG